MIIPALIRCPLRLILPLSLLLVAAPAGAVAQEDPGDATSSQGPQYDRVWRAIELGHADPLEMQDVVRSIFTDGIRTVVDQRTRTLLVSGIAPVIAQVQELVARLDVPVKSPAKKRTTFLEPRHRSARDLSKILKIHTTRGGRIAVDEERNALIVSETEETIEAMRMLLETIDKEPARINLEFLVLGEDGTPLKDRADERKIAEELKHIGLPGHGIIGRAAVRVLEGQEYEVDQKGGGRTLRIGGLVRTLGKSSSAEVRLQLSHSVKSIANGDTEHVRVETTLRVPLGDQVIVGLAPTGSGDRNPLALVLRVTID